MVKNVHKCHLASRIVKVRMDRNLKSAVFGIYSFLIFLKYHFAWQENVRKPIVLKDFVIFLNGSR